MLEDVRYRRGFLVAPAGARLEELELLERWTVHETDAWQIFAHPETPVRVCGEDSERVVVSLGDVFVAHGSPTLEECAARFGRGDLRVLDDLSGRFALLAVDGARLTAVQDPIECPDALYHRPAPRSPPTLPCLPSASTSVIHGL